MAADAPAVIVTGEPFAAVLDIQQPAVIVLAAGSQGPPGPPGVGGAQISGAASNQLEQRPDGLYAAPQWAAHQW